MENKNESQNPTPEINNIIINTAEIEQQSHAFETSPLSVPLPKLESSHHSTSIPSASPSMRLTSFASHSSISNTLNTLNTLNNNLNEMNDEDDDDINETHNNIQTIPPQMRDRIAEAKRQSISFEVEQESMLIALLARHGVKFVLLKPRKLKSTATIYLDALFVKIKQIIIGNQKFEFDQLIKEEMLAGDRIIDENETSQKRSKYTKRNLVSCTNNFLSELLSKIGYELRFKKSRMTSNVLKMNRLASIHGNGIQFRTLQEMKNVGIAVNKMIKNRFISIDIKRDTPLEFCYDDFKEFVSQHIPHDSILQNYIVSRCKFTPEEEQKYSSQVCENDKPSFLREGFEIRQMEFGWFATTLRREKE